MMSRAIATAALALCASAPAQHAASARPEATRAQRAFAGARTAPTAEQVPSQDFAVHCGQLFLGDGSKIDDVWMVVQGGRVSSIGKAQPPAELPVVDASDRVVMPGIVAVDSDLSGAADDSYAVTPDVLALDAFDFTTRLTDALEGGVTTAYLSPGRQRLISGQGSIVKTWGDDIVQRVLREAACLRVNMGNGATAAPRVFEPGVHPTDDDPIVPARIQTPTARISLLDELRALLGPRSASADAGTSTLPSEHDYDPTALLQASRGELPLRIAATEAADIRRALLLQQQLSVPMMLENPREIAPLAKRAAAQGIAALFRMPAPFADSGGDVEDRNQDLPKEFLDAPARAATAGMKVALAPATGSPMRDYLLAAGLAVRGGLSRKQALAATTGTAAEILGVGDRVGNLAAGMDADFVVLTGDPFAIGTMVESTWVSGHRAFVRSTNSEAIAVRCGELHTGDGRVLRQAVLIVQDAKIKAVGEGLAIPYGARVIDLPDAVMTPGLIDSFSHLGLAGDGKGVMNGQSNQLLHEVVRFDDPMFAPALAQGITTVLASGKDSGLMSGRVTAIKTGARDEARLVVKPISAQRMVFDAIGPDAIKPLRDAVAAGRKYVELWSKYEQELEAWKKGEQSEEKKPEEPKPEEPAEKKPDDPVTGTWETAIELPGGMQISVVLELRLAGKTVTGQVSLRIRDRELPPAEVENGTFENGKLRLEFGGMGGSAVVEGSIENDTFTGTVSMGPMGERELTGKRTSKSAPQRQARPARKSRNKDEPGPKKPDIDEGKEPMRAVLEGRAALVVRVTKPAAIEAVVGFLEAERIPYVLHGADGALDEHQVLQGKRPTILLDADVVRREAREIVNEAAGFVDLGSAVLLGSGACAGARDLPMQAAYAVRYGLAPDEALMALTSHAAKAFHIDDRVGSLTKGKDADFVVFSGDPFEPTSRVLLVGCNGQIVVDNRQETR